jgi:ABC-2 type transport system ATP-binding protein
MMTMNDNALVMENVVREFGGPPVLRGLNLKVPRGSIYGFLGRNGSGKTTAIKVLAGLTRPASGTVRVLGANPWSFGAEERRRVGYLSEKQTLPPLMRVTKLIRFCAQFYPAWDHRLCDGMLRRFEVPVKRRIHQLSLGQQRLLGFALAVAPRPDVLLLDEPAANLDVVARREFLDQILELIQDGDKTVFFSTHILSDVERVADRVGILAGGSLIADEPLDELKESVKQVRLFGFRDDLPEKIPGALNFRKDGREMLAVLRIGTPGDSCRLAEQLGCQAEERSLSLEDLFIELTRKNS